MVGNNEDIDYGSNGCEEDWVWLPVFVYNDVDMPRIRMVVLFYAAEEMVYTLELFLLYVVVQMLEMGTSKLVKVQMVILKEL